MPSFCSAIGCSNSSSKPITKEKKISYHGFPLKDKNLLKQWLHKMKRKGFVPNEYSKLCSEHFAESDFIYQPFTNRRSVKPGAVPSKFSFDQPSQPKRNRTSYEFKSFDSEVTHSNNEVATQTEDILPSLIEQLSLANDEIAQLKKKVENTKYSLKNAIKNETMFNSLTGFKPVVFLTVYELLKLETLTGSNIDPKEQFFIFLIRIKSGVTLDFLSSIFSIPTSTLSRIINNVVEHTYCKLKYLDIWPSKEQVQEYMPIAFAKMYPKCRVILDCTEIAIQKPSNPRLQQLTFSYYKNKNTLKALIGITPSGAVSYVSDLWCGGISDKELFLRSGLINKFEENDDILVDRGFTIQKELQKKKCRAVMPHFLKNNIQFSIPQRCESKSISHLRVHVERAISRIKTYRYFKGPLPAQCFHEANKIFYIVTMFTNFNAPLIKIN